MEGIEWHQTSLHVEQVSSSSLQQRLKTTRDAVKQFISYLHHGNHQARAVWETPHAYYFALQRFDSNWKQMERKMVCLTGEKLLVWREMSFLIFLVALNEFVWRTWRFLLYASKSFILISTLVCTDICQETTRIILFKYVIKRARTVPHPQRRVAIDRRGCMSWLEQRQFTYRVYTVRTIRCALGDRIEIGM